jgi:acylphosphatase
VAAVVEGDRRQIESLIAWCRQGPPYAYVEEVQVDWHPYQGEFDDFRIAY